MNKMIAITIRPGATTAAARLICPSRAKAPRPRRPGPARRCPATPRTAAAIPGADHRSPHGPRTQARARGACAGTPSPADAGSTFWAAAPLTASAPRAVPRFPGPTFCSPGTFSVTPRSFPSTAPRRLRNQDRKPAPHLHPRDSNGGGPCRPRAAATPVLRPSRTIVFPGRPAGQGLRSHRGVGSGGPWQEGSYFAA